MIVEKYKNMLGGKSVIRQLSEFAGKRGEEIGYENVFDYSLGNPFTPVPEEFTKEVMELLSVNAIHGYSKSLGIDCVRETVADYLKDCYGIPYKKEHIFMASGAAGALAHAIRLVAEAGDEIITFAPFFPEYTPYVELTGAKLTVIPPSYEDFQISFDDLEERIQEKTAAILINSPNNPSGVVYSAETLQKLADLLRRKSLEFGHTIFLISDEPYREIIFDQQEMPNISSFYEHTIMCYSFSKSLSLPGARIGYVAVHPKCEEAEVLIQMCGQISRGIGHNCPTTLMQYGVAKVLENGSFAAHDKHGIYEENRNILYKELIDLGFSCVKPQGTFYIFPKALEEDANIFCEKAMKYDLILVPGDSFGAPGYFRMAYCIEKEKVVRSLEAFRRFVTSEYKI